MPSTDPEPSSGTSHPAIELKNLYKQFANLLERPTSGQIILNGEALNLKAAKGGMEAASQKQIQRFRSRIGMVFQSFNLWQHMTVLQNVSEGPIKVQGRRKAEVLENAEALLERVGLSDKRHSYPAQLSGGQQQRAAIARALAMQPDVMLFDAQCCWSPMRCGLREKSQTK